MSQVVAILQNDPSLMPVQLSRIEAAAALHAGPGKAVGVGYFHDDQVLLRKKPVLTTEMTLGKLAGDLQTRVLIAAAHRNATSRFREEDTAPYRFHSWLFAGTGRILPLGERESVFADVPDFLKRGIGGPSDVELAFLATLAHLHKETRQIDHPDLTPESVVDALRHVMTRLDGRAREVGVPLPQTTALMTNGRVLAAIRRGKPLSYALLEGVPDSALPVLDEPKMASKHPPTRAMKALRAVVIASEPKHGAGVSWLEVPDNHALMVGRDLGVRVVGL